jgi:hypothetical protein
MQIGSIKGAERVTLLFAKERDPALQAGMHLMKIRKSRERKISNLQRFTWEKKYNGWKIIQGNGCAGDCR